MYVTCLDFNLSFSLNYFYFLFLFKIVSFHFSPQLGHLLIKTSHQYYTRSSNSYIVPYVKNRTGAKDFAYVAASKWNSLPGNVSTVCTILKFKIM